MEQIKHMLQEFEIISSPVRFNGFTLRKDGTKSLGTRFDIEQKQFSNFSQDCLSFDPKANMEQWWYRAQVLVFQKLCPLPSLLRKHNRLALRRRAQENVKGLVTATVMVQGCMNSTHGTRGSRMAGGTQTVNLLLPNFWL